MPPPRTSPFRKVTDWTADPWATPEEHRAWDRDRKRRWIASLSPRDWKRLAALAEQDTGLTIPAALDDLDAPLRVGVYKADEPHLPNGVRFGVLKGRLLLAWPKE